MDLFPARPTLSRADLVAAGFDDAELRRARRAGGLWRPRRGRYRTVPPPDEPMERHAATVLAAVPALAAEAVVSHVSAAALHGLPSWRTPLGRVHVSRHRRGGGRIDPLLHVHPTRFEPDELREVGGCRVTSVPRTIADCLRTLPVEEGLVIVDAALHGRLVVKGEVAEVLDRWPRRHGNARARRVLAFAAAGAESPGESRSRSAIHRAGLPAPVLQWEVEGVGRVDFAWPRLRTVGEFDGLVKYGRFLRPGQDAADAVVEEKLREDALRAELLGVVRWIWREIDGFDPVARWLRRQFALGAAHVRR
jgi:hypothetical protein